MEVRAHGNTPGLLRRVSPDLIVSPGVVCAGRRPGPDGGEADDAAAADGGRPAVAGAGGELHGTVNFYPPASN